MVTTVTRFGFRGAMHLQVEQADGTYALRESSEAYGGEFAQENEALTPENTIPWRKFAETVDR
jgi:hypothetical protein